MNALCPHCALQLQIIESNHGTHVRDIYDRAFQTTACLHELIQLHPDLPFICLRANQLFLSYTNCDFHQPPPVYLFK